MCLTHSLIYLPGSNVKRLWREAGSLGADCVFELMISSYSVILRSRAARIVLHAKTATIYHDDFGCTRRRWRGSVSVLATPPYL